MSGDEPSWDRVMEEQPNLDGVKKSWTCVALALPTLGLLKEDEFPKYYYWLQYLENEGFIVQVAKDDYEFTKEGKEQVALRRRYIAEAKKKKP